MDITLKVGQWVTILSAFLDATGVAAPVTELVVTPADPTVLQVMMPTTLDPMTPVTETSIQVSGLTAGTCLLLLTAVNSAGLPVTSQIQFMVEPVAPSAPVASQVVFTPGTTNP